MQTVVELVVDMSLSLLSGDHQLEALVLAEQAFSPFVEKLKVVYQFVSQAEITAFRTDLAENTRLLLELVSFESVEKVLCSLGVPLTKDALVGKKALTEARKRMVQAYKASRPSSNPREWSNDVCLADPSTQSTTKPENGKQMHLSTSSSPIPWTLRVWAEWVSGWIG